jgi:hypothetical protein
MKTPCIICILFFCSFSFVSDNNFQVAGLLQNPSQHNGKTVTVTGYFANKSLRRAIWATPEDEQSLNYKLSLWLDYYSKEIRFLNRKGDLATEEYLDGKFVSVTGTFKYKPDTINGKVYGQGADNLWPAQLEDIRVMREVK